MPRTTATTATTVRSAKAAKGAKAAKSDPARTLALLWGARSRAGRSGVTPAAVVAAAIGLADAEGLEAVSMRRVAERVGVGTMTLYTHVPGRAELTDLMLDAALAGLYDDVDAAARAPGGWRGALEFVAGANRALYERHLWLVEVQDLRPVLGPNVIRKYETELRGLEGHGLSDLEMDSVLTLVLTHVAASARIRQGVERTRAASGMDDDEWWAASAPALERLLDPAAFPVASRVGSASSEVYQGAGDPEHAYAFGLARILDGVAALVENRGAAPTSPPTGEKRPGGRTA